MKLILRMWISNHSDISNLMSLFAYLTVMTTIHSDKTAQKMSGFWVFFGWLMVWNRTDVKGWGKFYLHQISCRLHNYQVLECYFFNVFSYYSMNILCWIPSPLIWKKLCLKYYLFKKYIYFIDSLSCFYKMHVSLL